MKRPSPNFVHFKCPQCGAEVDGENVYTLEETGEKICMSCARLSGQLAKDEDKEPEHEKDPDAPRDPYEAAKSAKCRSCGSPVEQGQNLCPMCRGGGMI